MLFCLHLFVVCEEEEEVVGESQRESPPFIKLSNISCVHELNARHILLLLIGLDTSRSFNAEALIDTFMPITLLILSFYKIAKLENLEIILINQLDNKLIF